MSSDLKEPQENNVEVSGQKKLQEEIGILVGEATMCWQPRPSGVFDSTHAITVVDRIMKVVASKEDLQTVIDFAEWGWTIIANAHGGDWEKESPDWRKAAAQYRDDFHNKIRALASSVGRGSEEQNAPPVTPNPI